MTVHSTIHSLDTLREALRYHRHQEGWSLETAAKRTGVPAIVIGSYERGDRNPPLPNLLKILDGYGLRLAIVDNDAIALARITALKAELAKLELGLVTP
jgi:transcriptional regulator with XRE-family HTH domain